MNDQEKNEIRFLDLGPAVSMLCSTGGILLFCFQVFTYLKRGEWIA